ncbi:hypothetical protein [Streptomyces sp. NPDC021096]|uniref:hypothetical protein n=1 Tax=Streptomyces sp. NPDC021096 TaxID=3154792 RepID=UPI0033F2496A
MAWGLAMSMVAVGLHAASPTFASEQKVLSSARHDTVAYDARTVFRGVFFGHGPVGAALARHFPGLPAATPRSTAEENKLMDRLEETRPGVIEDFRAAVTSGSHVRTKQALVTTSSALIDTVRPSSDELEDTQPRFLFAFFFVRLVLVLYVRVTKFRAATEEGALGLDTLTHDVITAAHA